LGQCQNDTELLFLPASTRQKTKSLTFSKKRKHKNTNRQSKPNIYQATEKSNWVDEDVRYDVEEESFIRLCTPSPEFSGSMSNFGVFFRDVL
jgi:hypothetical protein